MNDFMSNVLASSLVILVLLTVMGLIFTVMTAGKSKKQRKYFEDLHKNLAPGQEVMFCGGIFGTVKAVNGDVVEIKVRSGAVIEVSRYAIQQISTGKESK